MNRGAPIFHRIIALAAIISISIHVNAWSREAEENSFDFNVHLVPVSHNQSAVVSLGDILLKVPQGANTAHIPDLYGTGSADLKFSNGRLIDFSRPGSETNYVGDATLFPDVARTNMVGVLKHWRKLSTSDASAWKYWEGSKRLRLWFANPNATGALFAEIAIILLASGLLFTRLWWLRSLYFLGSTLSVGGIFATASRGSFVAFLLGCLILLAPRATKSGKRNGIIIFVFVAAISALGAIIYKYAPLDGRFGRNLFALDNGNRQRLQAWRMAPAMLAATTRGWGNQCGIAYEEYFQPAYDQDPLIYLVNTHLEWMIAHGWTFAVLYTFMHILVFGLLLCGVRASNRSSALALSLSTTFFVACFFSTIGIYPSLWIFPSLALVITAWTMWSYLKAHWKQLCALTAISLAASCALVGILIMIGKRQLATMPVSIQRVGNVTFVGSGNPLVYLVPDSWALSRFFYGSMGADIRDWCQRHPGAGTLAIVQSIDDLPSTAERIVFIGLSAFEYVKRYRNTAQRAALCKAKSIAFIAPPFPSSVLAPSFYSSKNAMIHTGEFLAQLTGDANSKSPYVSIVPGAELYIHDWVSISFQEVEQ